MHHRIVLILLVAVMAYGRAIADDIHTPGELTIAYAIRTLDDGRTIVVGGMASTIQYQYRLVRLELDAAGSVSTAWTWPIDCTYQPPDIAILADGGLAAAGELQLVDGEDATTYSYLHVDAEGTATLRDLHPANQVWRGFVADRQQGLVVAYSGRPGAQDRFLIADFRHTEPTLRTFAVADDQVVLYSAALRNDTVVLAGTYVGGLLAMVIAVRDQNVLWANTYGNGYPDPAVIVSTTQNTWLHIHGRQTSSRDLVLTHLGADGSVIGTSALAAPGYQLVTSAEARNGRVVIGGMSEYGPLVISAREDGTEARMDVWNTIGLQHIITGVTVSSNSIIQAVSRSAPADPGLINGSRAATIFRGADAPAALDAPCRSLVPSASQETHSVSPISRTVAGGAPPPTGSAMVTVLPTTVSMTMTRPCTDVSSVVADVRHQHVSIDLHGSDLRITGIDGPVVVRIVGVLGTVVAERAFIPGMDDHWSTDHLARGVYVVVVSDAAGPMAVRPITVGF